MFLRRNLYLISLILLLITCKQDEDEVINPYDDPSLDPPIEDNINYFTDPTAFSALHNNIFSPTCANSGCHDGTFEPDFRTVESAYNTLIYHPIIKNDNLNPLEFRVKPGDAERSVLYRRLTEPFPNDTDDVMPIVADTSWYNHQDEYIQNVKDWINGGAKDIFGNLPVQANLLPQMKGMLAYISGQSTILLRDGFRGSIFVPSSANSLDVWFSVTDDQLVANQLTYNKIKYSNSLFNFEQKPEYSLEVKPSPLLENGYYGSQIVEYYHKYVLDVSNYNQGDIVFIKIYVQDNVNSVTEIPTNGSEYQIVKYFTLEFI